MVLLSADYRVVGMNAYARRTLDLDRADMGRPVFDYHPSRSRQKIGALLAQCRHADQELPVAMIIDVLGKVLMISVSCLEMAAPHPEAYWVASLVDVTRQTGAHRNPHSGQVQLAKFPIYERGCFYFLDTAEIYFFQSDGNYCKVRTAQGLHHIHASLKNILERHAGPEFFRVHKSYVANLRHVQEIRREANGRNLVVFDRPDIPPIPLARRRLARLKQVLGLE